MSEQARSIRIPDGTVRENYDLAISIIREAKAPVVKEPEKPGRRTYISPNSSSPATSTQMADSNFLDALKNPADPAILSPPRQAVYYGLRRAIAVGFAVGQYFVEPLGFLDLGTKNKSGAIRPEEMDKLVALIKAKAIVSLYATAAHLASGLAERPIGNAADIGAMTIENTTDALTFFVDRIAKAIPAAKTDEDVLGLVARVCADVMDRAESDAYRVMSQYLPDYTSKTFVVEEDHFRVTGFQRPAAAAGKVLDVAPKRPEEVVGNHLAKAQAVRLARMLVCHDFDVGKNPFVEIGGFIFNTIGDGQPGTGKTTLIQMIVTLLAGYCDVFGLPFRYENFGIDQISEFQGKSGQNCRGFIDRVLDPKTIGFGTIDDIDQVAGKRDDKRSSGGQQEVTGVLMDAFAGASTVIRGNAAFFSASNYPENVDPALRQRSGGRWLIDGPQSRDDYIDILALLLGGKDIPLGDHKLYAAQALRKMVDETYKTHGTPQEKGLLAVWEKFVKANGTPKTLTDLGTYLHMIKENDETFTGRAIKNVTDAVKTRVMDVDLPDEWFEKPELFARKPYAFKLDALKKLRKPVTPEIVLQEINRYADSEFRYKARSDEAEIARIVREAVLLNEAKHRIPEDGRT
jgi:hypothetical protein